MVHVKKTLTGICLSFAMVTPIMAQTSVQEQAKTQEQAVNYSQKVKKHFWYLGAKYFTPMYFNNLSSIPSGDKPHFGYGGMLNVGYQFSPLFSLDLNVGYGKISFVLRVISIIFN